ncbi:hypothetical protein SAMN04487851_11467 [Prevotella sp. tc2-28]|nr:hypothetical protein SAMN04487851_11467 [Prevotella sp. tc2-28]
MTEESRLRRKQKDHERYIASCEERKEYQRIYYANHRERCIVSVREAERKRKLRELCKKKGYAN